MPEIRPLSESVRTARSALAELSKSEAQRRIGALLEVERENDELIALSAMSQGLGGDPEAARTAIQDRLKVSPTAGLFAAAALIADFLGLGEESESMMRRARELDPDHFLTLEVGAALELAAGDPEASIELARRSSELYGETPALYAGITAATWNSGDVEEAIRRIEEAPAWFRETPQYRSHCGRILVRSGDLTQAEAELRRAVELCPEGSSYWSQLADILVRQKRYEEAADVARTALSINPRRGAALVVLARAAREQGDTGGAEEFERQAEALSGFALQKQFEEVRNLIVGQRYGEAADRLEPIAEGKAGHGARTARRLRAMLLIEAERWDEAAAAVATASRDDRHPLLRLCDARLRAHSGDMAGAMETARELIAGPRVFESAQIFLLRWLFESNREAEAQRVLDAYLSGSLGFPHVPGRMALELDKIGRLNEAWRVTQVARTRYPKAEILIKVERLLQKKLEAKAAPPPPPPKPSVWSRIEALFTRARTP